MEKVENWINFWKQVPFLITTFRAFATGVRELKTKCLYMPTYLASWNLTWFWFLKQILKNHQVKTCWKNLPNFRPALLSILRQKIGRFFSKILWSSQNIWPLYYLVNIYEVWEKSKWIKYLSQSTTQYLI